MGSMYIYNWWVASRNSALRVRILAAPNFYAPNHQIFNFVLILNVIPSCLTLYTPS